MPVATRCFPSERVFRRDRFDGTYYHYSYGQIRFRLRPSMWLRVQPDGIDIGDAIETTGLAMERELFVAQVWGMYYVRRKGCILYRLRRGDVDGSAPLSGKPFEVADRQVGRPRRRDPAPRAEVERRRRSDRRDRDLRGHERPVQIMRSGEVGQIEKVKMRIEKCKMTGCGNESGIGKSSAEVGKE